MCGADLLLAKGIFCFDDAFHSLSSMAIYFTSRTVQAWNVIRNWIIVSLSLQQYTHSNFSAGICPTGRQFSYLGPETKFVTGDMPVDGTV